MKPPKTSYTKVGESLVAYQVAGEGAIDLVNAFGSGSVDLTWDHPIPVSFLERLASFSRLIQFDPRGWGMSDRFAIDRLPTWEDWAEDLHAVLDAAGSERTAILAYGFASPLAMIFAATYPDRVSALIFFNSTAKWIASEDYPWGASHEQVQRVVGLLEQSWGTEELIAMFYPSLAGDERFKTYMARFMRSSGSPRMAAAQFRYLYEFDTRGLLPLIQVPTLVLHRTDSRFVPIEFGRHLAGNVQNARLIELPGGDEGPFTENSDEIIGHIEEFLTGVKRAPEPDRVLATVLFTDIVGSTERAAQLGDAKWKKLIDTHDAISREHVEAHRGRFVKHTGDGMLATFDGPARAIRCAGGLQEELEDEGIHIRAGLHTGEVELRGDNDIGGIGVHIGARVAALAGSGEILVSSTVKDLVVGSGIEFEDRGTHALKGVPDEWRLFAVKS